MIQFDVDAVGEQNREGVDAFAQLVSRHVEFHDDVILDVNVDVDVGVDVDVDVEPQMRKWWRQRKGN